MQKQSRQHRLLMGIPPWILLGAVIVLFPIFAFIAVENIHRQKEQGARLLQEKGAALIRSFEAGARTGMGMGWSNFRLQTLLFETAQQPDIDYIIVADTQGTILAHNQQDRIGDIHGRDLDLRAVSQFETVHWRIVAEPNGHKTFEVYRKFVPASGQGMQHGRMMGMMGKMMGRRWQQRQMEKKDGRTLTEPEALNIFVGLDMTAIEAAREADTRHFLLMVFILLLIGFSGIILLFFFQSYRATRASLSRIKAFSDTLVENMPIGLIAMDKQRRVASMNYVAGSVLGLSETDVTGSDIGHILPVQFQHQLDALEIEGRMDEREIEITVNDGRLIPLEISGTTLNEENGESLGYVLLFKDLTEVKALREEIERSHRLATVGRLAAGVAHEIRNPLSSIKGFATYFKERYRDVPEDQQTAGIMIKEVDRLNRVVSDLLEFARPIAVSKKPTPIKSLIEDSVKLIEQQADEKKITIDTELAGSMEPLELDPDRINQVLLNLYLNAIESMDAGGTLSISMAKDGVKNRIEIRIADTGSGIGEENLAHVFDPYFTTKSSGTGLGLAIAHKIVEGHNGEIYPESRPGEGTTFIVSLPIR